MGLMHSNRLFKTLISFSTLFVTIDLTVFLSGHLKTCYGIYDKGCVSVGVSFTPVDDDSWIVGECYWSQYGGLDNECQSGQRS